MPKSLLQNDLEIMRRQMDEALELYGLAARYYQLKDKKARFTTAGELSSRYFDPVDTRVIFEQAPKVTTLKKLGWVTELDQASQLLHASFNLPGISFGALFEIRDPLNQTSGRFFRVTKLQVGILFPSFVTCQIVPVVNDQPDETVQPYEGSRHVFLDDDPSKIIEEY